MSRYLSILSIFFALTAAGQQDSVTMLNPAVVTALRPVKTLNLYASEPSVISHFDIERSGAATITDVLQNAIPGMIFTPNAMGNNMRVRGLSSRYVLILVDGQRLAPEGAGGNVNLDRLAVGDVERIDVVNGAAGTLWGAGAMGAVINIITRTDGGAQALVEAGSHGTVRTAASVGFNGNVLSARAGAFRNSSAGFEGDITGMPYTDWGAAVSVGREISERTTINAGGRFFSHETFNRQGNLATTHKLAHSWSAGAGAHISGRHTADIKLNTDNYIDYDVLQLLKNQRRRQNRTSITTLRAVQILNDGRLTIGLDGTRETTHASTTLGAESASLALTQGALFGQNIWYFTHPTDISSSAVKADKILGGITAGARYTLDSHFGGAFSPSASVWWNLNKRTIMEGGVNISFRAPTIKELHYDFDHQGMFWIFGNPQLKPEKGLYSHISMSFDTPKFKAAITLYRNDISNKITQYYVDNDQKAELHYKNVGSATLQGFEVDLRKSWSEGFKMIAQATYNFCDAVDNTTHRQLDSNPRHSLAGALTWFTWRGWLSLQLGGRHTSALHTLSTLGTATRVGAAFVTRAAAVRHWGCGLSAGVRVENIFDRRSVLNPEGRAVMITLKYKL